MPYSLHSTGARRDRRATLITKDFSHPCRSMIVRTFVVGNEMADDVSIVMLLVSTVLWRASRCISSRRAQVDLPGVFLVWL